MREWKKMKFLDVIALNPRIKLEKGEEYAFVEMSNASETSRNPQTVFSKPFTFSQILFCQSFGQICRQQDKICRN